VRNQSGATSERKLIISAFRTRTPFAVNYPLVGKKPGFVERHFNNPAPRRRDRAPPINQNDYGGADPTKSLQKADLAFQRAMRRAIAQGLEHPPMIGVFKDKRPLNAPRLFDPVPHYSGCTSPAQECAELVAHNG